MISNRQIVDGVKDALSKAFKTWLDENRAEILKMIGEAGVAVVGAKKRPEVRLEQPCQPHFLTTAQLAERWHYHPVSVRNLVRSGALSCVRMGRRVRVPLAEVERYEQQATLGRTR